MREDMHKVIVERPRYGHSHASAKTRLRIRDYDPDKAYDYPSRISTARRHLYGYAAKSFNDFLSPVRRFLQKRVGTPWNAVYSELVRGLDRRKVTGRHVLQHVELMVERNCYFDVAGQPRAKRGDRPVTGLYVDPRDGALRKAIAVSKTQRDRPPSRVRVDALTQFERINGIWYLHISEFLDPREVIRYDWDPLKRVYTDVRREDIPGVARTHRVRTKQANKRELKLLHALLTKRVSNLRAV
jgi:hypothetical protein